MNVCERISTFYLKNVDAHLEFHAAAQEASLDAADFVRRQVQDLQICERNEFGRREDGIERVAQQIIRQSQLRQCVLLSAQKA